MTLMMSEKDAMSRAVGHPVTAVPDVPYVEH